MDQPAVATASTTIREDLVRGESFITASKPARKTSSFEREGWWRIALTSVQLSPGQYDVLPAPVPKYASRSCVFRSTVQRFPTTYFIPIYPHPHLTGARCLKFPSFPCVLWSKSARCSLASPLQGFRLLPSLHCQHEGPGPGHYNVKIPPTSSITSCFQSRVPRFLPSCSKTPGPGAYTTLRQFPKQSPTVAKMGREHSLFFNNTIGF
nr:protein STPG4 isoform X3 [Symphalangus syndactylus]